jgi:hypothetical protein
VVRVGAVDHVVGGRSVRRLVDGLDRPAERSSVRQPAVGFDGERDDGRNGCLLGGPNHADRLVPIGDGQEADEVGGRIGEGPHLRLVVALRLLRAHQRVRDVAVAPGADAAADEDGVTVFRVCAYALQELDGAAVDVVSRSGEYPSRAPQSAFARHVGVSRTRPTPCSSAIAVGSVVGAQRLEAVRVVEEDE